ncbi:hypothetical protein AB0H49_06445 [Nocardia sp. NPDC050713]|uniref:hypothetical protein n=1 Tax=Nocardia sp. NPDC050713 TaxID=3154511 RepID=UPI00340F9710
MVSAVFTSFVPDSVGCSAVLSEEIDVLLVAGASDEVTVRVSAEALGVVTAPASAEATDDVAVMASAEASDDAAVLPSTGASADSAAAVARAACSPASDETVPDPREAVPRSEDSPAPGDPGERVRFAAASCEDEPTVAPSTVLSLPSVDATVAVSGAAADWSAPPAEPFRVSAAAGLVAISRPVDPAPPSEPSRVSAAAVSRAVDRVALSLALSGAAAVVSGGSGGESFRPVGSLLMSPSDFGCA